MASLLVYVAPERLAAVVGDGVRAQGRVVPLRRVDLPGQLERLDEQSTLFVITVERGRAVVVATLEDPRPGDLIGEATLHDHDITELLVRLGCDKVWLIPEWASVPRIVPPNDVDLLRYSLGLALLDEPNADNSVGTPSLPPARADSPALAPVVALAAYRATDLAITVPPTAGSAKERLATSFPAPVPPATELPGTSRPATSFTAPRSAAAAAERSAEEALARALLAAIYAQPASDAPRRAYAAVLRNLGDPRSELIDLQLDRCRTGSSLTRREDDLLHIHRNACAGPLRPYLSTFELVRGFVARCVVREDIVVPAEIVNDPAWATVDDIASSDLGLLTSPQLAARTARIRGVDFGKLAESTGLLPFQTLLPHPIVKRAPFQAAGEEPQGIVLDPANLSRWPSVLDGGSLMRVRALKLDALSLGARMPAVLDSKLGQRLAHLDAWIAPDDAARWRAAFDRTQLPLLTLRGAAAGGAGEVSISLERTAGAPRVIVQSAPDSVAIAMAQAIAHDLHEIEVSTADLFARLRPVFPTVNLRPRPSLAL